jgi:hypothetical protein
MTATPRPEPADATLRADLLRALDLMDAYVGTFEGHGDYSNAELGQFVAIVRAVLRPYPYATPRTTALVVRESPAGRGRTKKE